MRSKRLSSLCGSFLTPFSSCHYKKTSLDLVFLNIFVRFVPSLYTTGEEDQTYPIRVSPVGSGVTYDTANIYPQCTLPGFCLRHHVFRI
jgi:hypothetical protein